MCSFCSQICGHSLPSFRMSLDIPDSVSPATTARTSKLSTSLGSELALKCPSGCFVRFLGGGPCAGDCCGAGAFSCARAVAAISSVNNKILIVFALVTDGHNPVNKWWERENTPKRRGIVIVKLFVIKALWGGEEIGKSDESCISNQKVEILD